MSTEINAEPKTFLILGYGYTGRILEEYLEKLGHKVITTSRTDGNADVVFDLEDKSTWRNIAKLKIDAALWLFPAKPVAIVEGFLNSYNHYLKKIIVVGSTSAFLTTEKHQVVNEKTELDMSQERVCGECAIRSFGGIAVHASGIYGPQREPLSWLKSGRIKDLDKYLNLIHVEDLCQFIYKAFVFSESGSVYIASDERPYLWSEIAEMYNIQVETNEKSSKKSKRINSEYSRRELDVQLKHPRFF